MVFPTISSSSFSVALVSLAVLVSVLAAVCSAAPASPLLATERHQDNKVAGSEDMDFDRYMMKAKKWYNPQGFPSGAAVAYGGNNEKWGPMRNFFPGEKRMDENFLSDYGSNLNPGRLEWNFNRL